jgi:DNA polymerase III subunit chi
MPEISFYLLPTSSGQDRDLYVCKLIEKAYRHGDYPFVLTGSPEHSQKIDDLLWTFRPGSFIPHQTYTGELPEFKQVILIGAAQPPDSRGNIIINLSPECPVAFLTAQRILEVIENNEEAKASGRNRYRHYQQAGLEIVTHNI